MDEQCEKSERCKFYNNAVFWIIFGILGVVFGLFLLYILAVGPEALTG